MIAGNGEPMSFGAYARARGCTRQAVSRQVAAGKLDDALLRRGSATMIDPARADVLWPRRGNGQAPAAEPRPRRSLRGSRAGSRANSEERYWLARAKREELRAALESGEQVDAQEVRRIGFARARQAQKALLAIPTRLPLTHELRELLRLELLRVCEQLANATDREATSGVAR